MKPRTNSSPISPRATDTILELASTQYGLVTNRQLIPLGVSPGLISGRTENSRLLRVCPGVHSVGRPISSRNALFMAAVLAAGEGAFLTDRSAAELWGFRRHSGPIEVVRGESRKPNTFRLMHPGVSTPRTVVVRRTRFLTEPDLSEKAGIPVLNPARVLLNLAARLTKEDFEISFKEADRLGLLEERALVDCAIRSNGWRGIKRFRRSVERRHPRTAEAKSVLEVLFLDICRDFGLGMPEVNRPLGRFYPDFRWPEYGLIVEVDGYQSHAGRMAFLDDAHRENQLRAEGNQVLRFTWEEVRDRPSSVAALVRQEQTKAGRNRSRTRP